MESLMFPAEQTDRRCARTGAVLFAKQQQQQQRDGSEDADAIERRRLGGGREEKTTQSGDFPSGRVRASFLLLNIASRRWAPRRRFILRRPTQVYANGSTLLSLFGAREQIRGCRCEAK